MRLSIKLNLNILVSTTFSENFYLEFTNITDMNHWYTDENVTELEFNQGSANKTMYVFTDGDDTPTYDEQDGNIVNLSDNDEYITFTCDIADSSLSRVVEFIDKGVIELDQNGKTSLILYRLNDEKDKLNKSLIPINIIEGNFKAPLGVKNIEIDVINYDIDNSYNYVYIPKLKRYYYIINIQLVNKEFTRLILQEDVLMSWKQLIKLQSAFVTRSEQEYNESLVDDRYPLENIKTVAYYNLDHIATGNKENVTFTGSFDSTKFNILISVMGLSGDSKTNVTAPNSNLPNLTPNIPQSTHNYFVNYDKLRSFLIAIRDRDDLASYVNSVIFLPFDPKDGYDLPIPTTTYLEIGIDTTYVLCVDHQFHDIHESPMPDIDYVKHSSVGASPYLVIADFQFPLLETWEQLEPFRIYELYIPFVGWIKLDSAQVNNKRLLLYYTLDYETGNATAYLYNYTDSKIIYSCGCQMGIKVDILSSNTLELSRERQSLELNTLLGLISSAVSVGIGVASENPVAVVGGVLSASKTIANAVNRNRMMFERGQVTFGSGDSGVHSDLTPRLRMTYYKRILSGANEHNIYYHLQGRPCNKYMDLSTILSGYVEVGELHFDPKGYNIYNDEITEIVQLLQNGVIF